MEVDKNVASKTKKIFVMQAGRLNIASLASSGLRATVKNYSGTK